MKHQILVSAEQKHAEDQLRRGVSLRVNFKYLSECSGGYAIGDRPIVQYMPSLSGNALIVELLDPNPEYAECGEPLQTIWIIDLNDELDLIDEIEAISDHLIDHQARHESPCENHPDERCGDCHLRKAPCFKRGKVPCEMMITHTQDLLEQLNATSWQYEIRIAPRDVFERECISKEMIEHTFNWKGQLVIWEVDAGADGIAMAGDSESGLLRDYYVHYEAEFADEAYGLILPELIRLS